MHKRLGLPELGNTAHEATVRNDLLLQKIIRVHPAFRIILLAAPPAPKHPQQLQANWLTSEVVSLFHFHHLSLDHISLFSQKYEILKTLFPSSLEIIERIRTFDHSLHTQQIAGLPTCLSLRQLIRIVRLSR